MSAAASTDKAGIRTPLSGHPFEPESIEAIASELESEKPARLVGAGERPGLRGMSTGAYS